MKRTLFIILLLAVLLLAAKPLKVAYLDVGAPPVDTVEFTGKAAYQQCVYWQADEYTDYAVYLGWFGAADPLPADPLGYCLEHFAEAQP